MTWVLIFGSLAFFAAPMLVEAFRKRMGDSARETAPGSFATLSQGVTHYQWFGPVRGPVLVCVHGLTTPSFVWKRMVAGLALLGFRVLTYDLYGRGFSDRPDGPQSRAFFIQQLNDLMAHEQIDGTPVTLFGYSMGGSIVTVFAAQHPNKVRQLILLAPAGMGIVSRGIVGFIARTPVIGDWLMFALYPGKFRQEARSEGDAEIVALQVRELQYRRFVPAVLASVRGILAEQLQQDHTLVQRHGIPVLAIWGLLDKTIPLKNKGKLAKWNSDVDHVVIDAAGHGLAYTHPEGVLAAIEAYLAGQKA